MNRLIRLFRLPSSDRQLLLASGFLLSAIRLALWLIPFGSLQRLLSMATRKSCQAKSADQTTQDSVVWAVTTAARYVPAVTCLTKALAAHVLLARRGFQACDRPRDHLGSQGHAPVSDRGGQPL